jgi:hypothetical protein
MPKRKAYEAQVKEEEEGSSSLSYEEQRLENIRKNTAFLQELGLDEIKGGLEASKPSKTSTSRRGVGARSGAVKKPVAVTRRSGRVTVERLRVELEDAKGG